MIEEPKVLPECEADTTLVDFLLDTTTNHRPSITKVEKRFREAASNQLLIGVVDNDKRQLVYFSDFQILREEHSLILKQKPDTRQYLIFVNPEMEQWLVNCAGEVPNLNPKFQKFTELEKLRRLTKSQAIQTDTDFKNFLNMLWQKEVLPIVTLEQWLKELLG